MQKNDLKRLLEMAKYNIVEKVEMCSDDCCGKPITECVCGPDCEHCDCHAKNNINESYSDDDDNRTVSNCCGADAYIRHNEISVGDTSRCSDCREMAEFIPEKDFFESINEEPILEEGMVSSCCGAPLMSYNNGHGRCSDCKEMASGEEVYESTKEINRIKELAGITEDRNDQVFYLMKKSLLRGKWYLENEEMDPEMVSSELRDINNMLDAVEDGIDDISLVGLDTSVDEQYMHLHRQCAAKLKGAVSNIYGVDHDVLPLDAKPNPDSPYNSGQVEESSIAEEFEPHMMYDPKTGEGKHAKVEKDHLDMKAKGWGHDKPNKVNEEHNIDILKAVAQQMEQDAHTGDFTAIEELLQDIPQENLEAFLTDHRSKNEYPEENIQPAVETVEQNEEKGNE